MIARHPFGAPQTVQIGSDGDVVTVVWRVGAPDDLTLLGIELGVLPADRVMLDGAIEYDASDASTVAGSDALAAYVLDHIAVSSADGNCPGEVVEIADLVEDGATLAFTCSGPVAQADVEVTTLTDLHPAYRTLATGPEGQRAVYDEAGAVQTWRLAAGAETSALGGSAGLDTASPSSSADSTDLGGAGASAALQISGVLVVLVLLIALGSRYVARRVSTGSTTKDRPTNRNL